jgi:hypothetical protein
MKPGTYKARAKEWALGISSTGKEQIAVMFQIVGGEIDGQSITWFGYFTEGAIDRTLDSMRHCGWDSDSLAEIDALGNNEVEIVVEEESYDGKTRCKVKWVNRISKLALKEQMTPSAAQAFAAKLRGKTVAHKRKYGAQPAAQSRSNGSEDGGGYFGPPPTDDDLNF